MSSKDIILFEDSVPLTSSGLYHSEDRLFPPVPDSCELTVECRRDDFSASLIARAVEDAEAHLLNMNVTSRPASAGNVSVDIRVSHRNGGSVARSLERYGFEVISIRGGMDRDLDTTRSRIGELMAHIDV